MCSPRYHILPSIGQGGTIYWTPLKGVHQFLPERSSVLNCRSSREQWTGGTTAHKTFQLGIAWLQSVHGWLIGILTRTKVLEHQTSPVTCRTDSNPMSWWLDGWIPSHWVQKAWVQIKDLSWTCYRGKKLFSKNIPTDTSKSTFRQAAKKRRSPTSR